MISLAIEVLSILAPSAFLALIGIVWYHRGPEYPIKFVTTLVVDVGMPALLFYTLATSKIEILELARMAFAALLVHLIIVPLAIIALKVANKDWRLCVAMSVGNTGNLGLPICLFAFGEEGLAYAMAFFSVQVLLLFSFGDAVYAGRANIAKTLRSPVLICVVIGVIFRLSGFDLPEVVADTTKLLGQLVIPIMLITLGVSLAGMRAKHFPSALLWSSIRIILTMAVGFSLAHILGFTGVARGVLILETVVPVAVFNFLLLVRHDRDPSEVSSLILVTHLAAIIYLPIVLALLLR
ncbi:MAG: AEC family transporter [Granulosicoccaceae bacterium]